MITSTTNNSNKPKKPLETLRKATIAKYSFNFFSISYLVALFIFGFLLLITKLLFNENPDPETKEIPTPYGISFKIPKYLERIDTRNDDAPNLLTGVKDFFQVLLPEPEQDETGYRANILFSADKITNFKDLEVYAYKQNERIKNLGTFEILSDPKKCQKIELDKYSGCEIIYQGYNGKYNLKRRRIVAKSQTQKDHFLIITYTADVNNFDKYESDFEQIVKSIKLLKE